MKKFLSIMALVLTLSLVFVACGKKETPTPEGSNEPGTNTSGETSPAEDGKSGTYGTTLADIQEKGTLVMGLDDTFAPMGFREADGSLVGFDIDLANAVGEKLGFAVEFQTVDWDAKEMELSVGNIDCIWNGFSLTPARQEQLTMSNPYLSNKIVIMGEDSITVDSKEDLKDLNIGIQAGSAALEAVQADPIYDEIKDQIVEYPTYDEVILDMQTGRLNCMIIDQVFGEYKNAKLDGIYQTMSIDFGEDLYAIGFRNGDTDLADAVNQAIAELVEDGTAEKISTKWFGKNMVLNS